MGGNNVNITFGANIAGLAAGVEGVKAELQSLAGFTEGLTSTFTEIGEVIAAAFAIEQIASFIDHMAELGDRIESTSAQLGRSTEEVMALKYAARVADTDLEALTKMTDKFYLSVQAAGKATSGQAAAFRALGIDTKALRDQGVDLNTIFEMTIEKLAQYKDGANKTLLTMELLGSKSAQTVKLVNILGEGMGSLVEKSQALAAPTERQLSLWSEVSVRLADLSTVMDNWKLTMGDISLLAVGMAEGFVEFLSIVKAVFDGLGIILVGAMNNIADFGIGVKNVFAEIADPGAGYFERIKTAAKVAMQHMKDDTHSAGQAITDLIDQQRRLINTLEHPTLQDKGTKKGGKEAPEIIDPGEVKKQMQVWEDALTDMLLKKQLFGLDALRYELDYWQDRLKIAKKGSDDYYAIEKKIYSLQNQLNTQRLREEERTEKQREQIYNRFFNSFNSGLMGMIKGTSTWRDAVRSAFFNVLENGLKMMQKMLAHWIATEHTKTAATVAGNAARVASDKAGAAASSGGFGATAIAQIQGDAAKAYGGVYGFLAPAIGPLAAIPAAAAYVAVIGMEALIPSFDVGTWNVPFDTVAMLHKNERVLTESENMFGTGSGGAGGGMTANFYGGINDRKGIRQLLMEEGATLRRSIEKQGKLSNVRNKK